MPKAPLGPNQHFIVEQFQSRKDVVQGSSDPVVPANSVAIWLTSTVELSKRQSLIGTLECLFRYASANLEHFAGATTLSLVQGGTEGDIVVNGAGVNVNLKIGDDVRNSVPFQVAYDHLIDTILEGTHGN